MLKQIFDWSEVWAVLIPIAALVKHSKQPKAMRPVILYLCIAFILNLIADIIWKQAWLNVHLYTDNNNPIYNTHSVLRVLIFSIFFGNIDKHFLTGLKWIIPISFLILVIINFYFIDDYFARKLSQNLHILESAILLFYCLQYYFFLLFNETGTVIFKSPTFLVITGLSIFVIVSFPIYLFYNALLREDLNFARKIWLMQKLSFIAFCILTTRAFSIAKNE